MRKSYETGKDRKAEKRLAIRIINAWGNDSLIFKNPRFYQTDFTITNRKKQVEAYVEVKIRRHKYGKHPTVNLSKHKWDYGSSQKMPCFFVVCWWDGSKEYEIRYLKMNGKEPEEIVWGRDDRGDDQDIEPSVSIPLEWFRPLDEIKEEHNADEH